MYCGVVWSRVGEQFCGDGVCTVLYTYSVTVQLKFHNLMEIENYSPKSRKQNRFVFSDSQQKIKEGKFLKYFGMINNVILI